MRKKTYRMDYPEAKVFGNLFVVGCCPFFLNSILVRTLLFTAFSFHKPEKRTGGISLPDHEMPPSPLSICLPTLPGANYPNPLNPESRLVARLGPRTLAFCLPVKMWKLITACPAASGRRKRRGNRRKACSWQV